MSEWLLPLLWVLGFWFVRQWWCCARGAGRPSLVPFQCHHTTTHTTPPPALHPSALVVTTVMSGVIFAHFPTVECIPTTCSFLLWRHKCSKKVPVEKESHFSMGGAIIFLALFPQNYIHWQQHNISRSCDTYSHFSLPFFCLRGYDIT